MLQGDTDRPAQHFLHEVFSLHPDTWAIKTHVHIGILVWTRHPNTSDTYPIAGLRIAPADPDGAHDGAHVYVILVGQTIYTVPTYYVNYKGKFIT